jgi:2'-5' RNA ligase
LNRKSEKADPGNTWRVFCAVELTAQIRQLLLQRIVELKKAVPEARASWSREENLHLTVKFLDEIPEVRVADLSAAASRAVSSLAPFEIQFESAGAFPKNGLPRVLWIGIRDSEGKLQELQARLEAEATRSGFAKEERVFHPHLTLARIRNPEHARELANVHKDMPFESVTMNVAELLVIRSELNSKGSRYTIISRHSLPR